MVLVRVKMTIFNKFRTFYQRQFTSNISIGILRKLESNVATNLFVKRSDIKISTQKFCTPSNSDDSELINNTENHDVIENGVILTIGQHHDEDIIEHSESHNLCAAEEFDVWNDKNRPNYVSAADETPTTFVKFPKDGIKRVAVIGAGISGICAAKNILEKHSNLEPVIFERCSGIGGTWLYTDKTETDEHGLPVHSCLYKSLRSNNPKQLLTFPGFPFPETENSYVRHTEILNYIHQFFDHYGLQKYTKLSTIVKQVEPLDHLSLTPQWRVRYHELDTTEGDYEQEFDAVVVANGHYTTPYLPEVKGIQTFPGAVLHSKNYRDPLPFRNQNVLILGSSYSAKDLCKEISNVANRVYVSNICRPLNKLPNDNVTEHPGVDHVTGNKIIFKDGVKVEADSFIYCTGFVYDFPFLSEKIITVDNQRVTPLYKHIFHIFFNNLVFIGIPSTFSYFPQCHEQARAAAAYLNGEVPLPVPTLMLRDEEADYHYRLQLGMEHAQAHYMGLADMQFRYNADLAKEFGFKPIPKVLQKIITDVAHERLYDFYDFRHYDYKIIDENTFERQKIIL